MAPKLLIWNILILIHVHTYLSDNMSLLFGWPIRHKINTFLAHLVKFDPLFIWNPSFFTVCRPTSLLFCVRVILLRRFCIMAKKSNWYVLMSLLFRVRVILLFGYPIIHIYMPDNQVFIACPPKRIEYWKKSHKKRQMLDL